MTPAPIETAAKDGGWILAHVPSNAAPPYNQPWVILSWGDSGWASYDGGTFEPIEWVSLPDPQPAPTGWAPAAGRIRVMELAATGWTDQKGKPVEVPWRWMIDIERPDGSTDEYRSNDVAATREEADRRAAKWQQQYGLPIVIMPLDDKVIPFPVGARNR